MTINLLSEAKQENLKKKLFFDLAMLVLIILLLLSVLVSIGLLSVRIVLQNQFNTAVTQAALVTNSFAQVNKRIRLINNEIQALEELVSEKKSWATILKEVGAATPKDLRLKRLSVFEDKIQINGFAGARDSLLAFITGLEGLGIFEQIESPLANILQKNNVTFELNANFKKIR